MNFLPGTWGDNLYGWWADFFWPAMELLATAPLIATRGNHENCARAGHGYFLFLYYDDYPSDVRAGDWCDEYTPPFTVPFQHEQFLVMDDSAISPKGGGIDHFDFIDGACPNAPLENDGVILALPQSRYDDPKQTASDVMEQINQYKEYFDQLEAAAMNFDTNFYVSHHPLFAIACNASHMVTLDWTMQMALSPMTLDRVSAMIGGHMHWFGAFSFENQTLPAQVVVGNGGTMLIDNYVNQDALPFVRLEVGQGGMYQGTVESGITSSNFGFGIMQRHANDSYTTDFYNVSGVDIETPELLDFQLDIPKGPRV